MHTLGREREKEHARSYLRDSKDASLIDAVIDIVHDQLEGNFEFDRARRTFLDAFENGKSGVWEQAGSWLRKTAATQPRLHSIWLELTGSTKMKLRRIAAAFATDLPPEWAVRVIQALSRDASKNVRLKVASDLTLAAVDGAETVIEFWLQDEDDEAVRSELERAKRHAESA